MALTFGEQAICKSVEEVLRMPIHQRDALIKKVQEAYDQQRKEMEKSSRKGKGGGTQTVASY